MNSGTVHTDGINIHLDYVRNVAAILKSRVRRASFGKKRPMVEEKLKKFIDHDHPR